MLKTFVRIAVSISLTLSCVTVAQAQPGTHQDAVELALSLPPNEQIPDGEIVKVAQKMDPYQVYEYIKQMSPGQRVNMRRNMLSFVLRSKVQPVTWQELLVQTQGGTQSASLGGVDILVIVLAVGVWTAGIYTYCLATNPEAQTNYDVVDRCFDLHSWGLFKAPSSPDNSKNK